MRGGSRCAVGLQQPNPEDSGKWACLREIVETIAAKQEKALVFTQFRELTRPLEAFLGYVLGRPGLVLDGEREVRKRKELTLLTGRPFLLGSATQRCARRANS